MGKYVANAPASISSGTIATLVKLLAGAHLFANRDLQPSAYVKRDPEVPSKRSPEDLEIFVAASTFKISLLGMQSLRTPQQRCRYHDSTRNHVREIQPRAIKTYRTRPFSPAGGLNNRQTSWLPSVDTYLNRMPPRSHCHRSTKIAPSIQKIPNPHDASQPYQNKVPPPPTSRKDRVKPSPYHQT